MMFREECIRQFSLIFHALLSTPAVLFSPENPKFRTHFLTELKSPERRRKLKKYANFVCLRFFDGSLIPSRKQNILTYANSNNFRLYTEETHFSMYFYT